MRLLTVLFPLAIIAGCGEVQRPVARQRPNDMIKVMQEADAAIARAKEDPDISEDEFKLIEKIETVRSTVAVCKSSVDLNDELPAGMTVMTELSRMMLVALQDMLRENEASRDECLKMAEECETDYPKHAKTLRELAAELATINRMTDIRINRLEKQLR